MSIPRFTIIIATYNSGKTLAYALDSIRHQTYKDIETIVVDGKSTDNTLDIIYEYRDVVSKYISEKDSGIFNAFNKGLNMATGEYVCFLGSDDCYYDYRVFENIDREIGCATDVLSSIEYLVDDETKYEILFDNDGSIEYILSGGMLPHAAMFVRRRILLRYKFNENNRIISDYEFLLRYVLDGGKIKRISIPVVYFSRSGISSSDRWSENGLLRIYEHIRLMINLNLDKQYFYKFMRNNFSDLAGDCFGIIIKVFLKKIAKITGLIDIIKLLLGEHRKHKCALIYCRWCKRDEREKRK